MTISALHMDYINTQRTQMKLISNTPLENAPPSLAFATVAMGAFRGLVVDILWMRADSLKEKGQFFDARQIAEWITILQPRFATVWAFHAWNMAYNISVAIPASRPDQRWQWVRNGYELLRDKGIELNPNSVALYHELGWIFQQKMGGVTDEAHKYYKIQLATAIGQLVGGADNAFFNALVAAPKDFKTIASDPNMQPFLQALKDADKKFAEAGDAKFVDNYLALLQNPDKFEPRALEVVKAYIGTETLSKFDIFAKAYKLRNSWKLEPEIMVETNKKYGPIDIDDPNITYPLDWLHPDTHAIYWAVKGLKVAEAQNDGDHDFDEIRTDRIISHSLQNLFRYGKIFLYDIPVDTSSGDPNTYTYQKQIFLRPDFRIFDSYNKTQLKTIEKYKDDRSRLPSLQNSHKNMLTNALFSFYQAGHKKKAQKIFNELKERYPSEETNISFQTFVNNRFKSEMEGLSIRDATEMIIAMLRQAYYYYTIRSDDEAYGLEQMVIQIRDIYNNEWPDDENRVDLDTLPRLRYMAAIDFLEDQMTEDYIKIAFLSRLKNEQPQAYEELEKYLSVTKEEPKN